MTRDPFANPFTLTNNDRRSLNRFFEEDGDSDDDNDDCGSYERVNNGNLDRDDEDDDLERAVLAGSNATGTNNIRYQNGNQPGYDSSSSDDDTRRRRRRRATLSAPSRRFRIENYQSSPW